MAPNDTSPPKEPAPSGIFFDGTSNRRRSVTLRLAERLEILEAGEIIAIWPYDDIRRADGDNCLRLSSVSAPPLARLEVRDETAIKALVRRCGSLDRDTGSPRTWPIVGWSLAAACSILLLTLYGIPYAADRLAPLIPYAIEKRFGDAVDRQIQALLGAKVCEAPEGSRALAHLSDRLTEAGGTVDPVQVRVLSSGIPNAIALPGGRIYLFDGLLRQARDADELAGVIAHELGHVHRRDGLRRLIETGGTSFLFGLLFGDVTGAGAVIFAARSIVDAAHSREAEIAADDFAIAAMAQLGRSPTGFGELLVRITGKTGGGTILDTHPVSAERLARMTRDATPAQGPTLLTVAEWRALKLICGPPKADG